jgi:hypothetical protein
MRLLLIALPRCGGLLRPIDKIPIASYTRLAGTPSAPQTRCGKILAARQPNEPDGLTLLTGLPTSLRSSRSASDTPAAPTPLPPAARIPRVAWTVTSNG